MEIGQDDFGHPPFLQCQHDQTSSPGPSESNHFNAQETRGTPQASPSSKTRFAARASCVSCWTRTSRPPRSIQVFDRRSQEGALSHLSPGFRFRPAEGRSRSGPAPGHGRHDPPGEGRDSLVASGRNCPGRPSCHPLSRTGDEVRNPHEPEDKAVGRLLVDLVGRPHLPDRPLPVHDGDPVGEGQGHLLVVRHVEDGHAGLALELLDLEPHLLPEVGVEVAQRLVEEHDLGPGDEGPGQGDPLLLPSRELVGQPLFQAREVDLPDRLAGPSGGLFPGNLLDLERVGDVVEDALVGPDRVVLKDDADPPRLRREVNLLDGARDERAADEDLPLVGLFEAGDEAEDHGLAAARGAEEREALPVPDGEVEVADDRMAAVGLADPMKPDFRHDPSKKS